MRTLPYEFVEQPEFQEWRSESEKARTWVVQEYEVLQAEKAKAAAAAKKKKAIKEKSWKIKWGQKQEVWKKHKKLLIEEFHGKCMYCEGRYVAGAHDAAEHYVPKGEVTVGRKRIDHPGYYWLAFEWQNILLACEKCNSRHPDGIGDQPHEGKLNEFRVEGRHVDAPGPDPKSWWPEVLAQKPRLLHPYFDRPENHFGVKPRGYVYGTSEKGRETVDVCDLNRPWLRRDREEREKLVRRKALEILDRLEKNEDFDDLLYGFEQPFSLYLNLRLEQYAWALKKHTSKPFARPKPAAREPEARDGSHRSNQTPRQA